MNRVLNYTGEVWFISSDLLATIPEPYTFQTADQGYIDFIDGVTFRTAGLQTITAIDTTAGVSGESQGTNVSSAEPSSLVITPIGPVPVTVEGNETFTAYLRDTYGNLVSGRLVTIVIKDPPNGILGDDPENTNNTTGGDDWQQGTTDATGTITVRYTAPSQADSIDILDAYSSTIDSSHVKDVTVISRPAGATKLVIFPEGSIQSVAGVPFSLSIEAHDSNGNKDDDDTTLVFLSSSSDSMKFSIDNFQSTVDTIRLSEGMSPESLKAMDIIANTPWITVEDADPDTGFQLISDTKSDISILPADPEGFIQLSVTGRDTLTANNSSTTTIRSQPITDLYGNAMESGEDVTVSAEIGTIISQDVNPGEPGVQVDTDTLGTIAFTYRAGSAAGFDTLTAASVAGNAAGTVVLLLQSTPDMDYTAGTLNPNTVSPGTNQEFRVELVNSGEAGVTLHDSSYFNFGVIGQTEFRSPLATSYFIAGGGLDTIRFLPDTIPDDMPEGVYTPTVEIYGTDSNGAPFDQAVLILDDNRLHVSSLILTDIIVFADTVSHGDSVGVKLVVHNTGGTTVSIDEAGLVFSPSGGQFEWDFPDLPVPIFQNGTGEVSGNIQIESLTPPGPYSVDAFVIGSSTGGAVSDSSANNKALFEVVSAAHASYVDGSIQPNVISGSGTYNFQLDVINLGDSDINLNEAQTHLVIGDSLDIIDVYIPREVVMPGDSTLTSLTFMSGAAPDSIVPGKYPATLFLYGTTQHAGQFQQVIGLSDSVTVESPPEMSYFDNSISNQVVSTGYEYAFTFRVSNQGGADLVLDPSGTVFRIEGSDTIFTSSLNSQGASTIAPGTDTTLAFLPAMVPGSLASGTHPGRVILHGNYNAVSFTDTLETDVVSVESPATLHVAKISSPVDAAPGETFSVDARVTNQGEADISTSGTLVLRTESLTVEDSLKVFGPNLPNEVTWQVTVPSDLSSGDYLLTISVAEAPLDENSGQPAKQDNPQGVTFALSVVEKNRLSVEGIDIDGVPPQNVFRGQDKVPVFPILVRSIGDKEGDIQLDGIDIRVEERGGILISNPATVLDRIYLTTSLNSEEPLAESSEPVQDLYTLSFTEPYIVGSTRDTLFAFVDVSGGANVVTFQLMIDGENAIEAIDLATKTPANVVEGNTENPLGSLRSRFTVLNQRDFVTSFKNYPNPMGGGDGSTTFSYYLPDDAEVSIFIYTLTGGLVKRLVFTSGENGGRGSEVNQVRWGGYNGVGRYVNNGVYICFATARTRGGKTYSTKHKLAVMR
jgi:hypothetical protein